MKMHIGYGRGNMEERAHVGCLSVGKKIILKKDVKEIGWESMDCTCMA
jgi:hypothetical protein